jgi:hypothetical protein
MFALAQRTLNIFALAQRTLIIFALAQRTLIIVNRYALRKLGNDSLGTMALQFRIVVFDDVDNLVYERRPRYHLFDDYVMQSDNIYLTRRAIIAKTFFSGNTNILLSSEYLGLEQGSTHLDTYLYLAGAFQNNVSIHPEPMSPHDYFMANHRDILNLTSVNHFVFHEDQKLLNHGYFLKHHVLQPLSHDVEPITAHLKFDF